MFSRPCEPAGEHADICDEDPCLGGSNGSFEVLCEPAASSEPGECPLDHPTARQDLEAFGAVGTLDDFERELADLLQGSPQLRPGIAAIGEDMAQPRPALEDRFQDGGRSVAVLNVGGMDDQPDHEAERIDDDMPLAAHDLLARVKATYSTAFGGLDRLAVDDAGTGAGLFAFALACHHHQFIVDGAKPTLVTPAVEIFLHRRERRKILRQEPPRAARRRHIQKRVHHLAQRRLARPTDAVRRRHQRFDQRPLRVGQIACVTGAAALIVPASGFGPGHRDLRRISEIRLNHNLLKSLAPFWNGH